MPELWDHVSIGGKSFTLRGTHDSAKSSDPSAAEIADRRSLDFDGHFAATPKISQSNARFRKALRLRELVDETGLPLLRVSGTNFNHRALAIITFPDQRSMWFPVRGSGYQNAIMTAVDEAGRSVARYRIIRPASILKRNSAEMLALHAIEITVHPGRELTDELATAITISAPWLPSYFSAPELLLFST
jgi:hypothetical protein